MRLQRSIKHSSTCLALKTQCSSHGVSHGSTLHFTLHHCAAQEQLWGMGSQGTETPPSDVGFAGLCHPLNGLQVHQSTLTKGAHLARQDTYNSTSGEGPSALLQRSLFFFSFFSRLIQKKVFFLLAYKIGIYKHAFEGGEAGLFGQFVLYRWWLEQRIQFKWEWNF